MEIDERSVRLLVEEVIKRLDGGTGHADAAHDAGAAAGPAAAGAVAAARAADPGIADGAPSSAAARAAGSTAAGSPPFQPALPGVFADIEAAIGAAREAFGRLASTSLEVRGEMIRRMREAALANNERIAALAAEETGLGRVEHKIMKNRLAAEMTPGIEDLKPLAWTDDHGLMLTELAPYGVIGAITPSTNPTSTIICNSIAMVAAGNTVVFNAHPKAKQVSAITVGLLNEAIMKAGGPPNVLATVANPTIASAQALMDSPRVALLTVTGGPDIVREALKRPKKAIVAGPGNPPVVVDETADLAKAAEDIVNGASLDNNIICIDEKEILAVESIADHLKAEMIRRGAYELTRDQIDRITPQIIAEPGREGHEGAANKNWVGKNASVIADQTLGLHVPADTKILLCEVDRMHPLVWTEQLMPVIPISRFRTADEAIDFAVRCEHGFRHTASIHSKNIEALSRMAKVMNCSLFVKNGSNYNGMAAGGAGFTSFTIASPTGEGFTRPRTFSRERRCSLIGYFRIV